MSDQATEPVMPEITRSLSDPEPLSPVASSSALDPSMPDGTDMHAPPVDSRPPPAPTHDPIAMRTASAPAIPRARGRGGVGSLARGGGRQMNGSTRIPPSLQAKMAAMAAKSSQASASASTPGIDSATLALMRTSISGGGPQSSTANAMAARRTKPGLKLSDIGGGPSAAGLGGGRPTMQAEDPGNLPLRKPVSGTPFANFSKIVDPSGALNFGGKAVIHAKGVDFSNGSSFNITMDQLRLDEELGRGNYGTVKKVWHIPTNVQMAMKEIRLELDDAKLHNIIMELDILHRAVAPEIVEFYGAFFIESCVYYCMEYMDAGSLDRLCGEGVPEPELARITGAMVRGLKFLKDELQIMHRDVKPTNVLVNKKGEVKLCDFGVSGQLEKSLARTNIGCQSYMAPERIKGESQNNLGAYTVSSDVWSLGLSIIELAIGKYPYPPETYSNVFAQLTAIVHGPPPELPEGYSEDAQTFVMLCLMKEPSKRASYAELLDLPFLANDRHREVDMVAWVKRAIEWRDTHRNQSSSQPDGPPAEN